MSYESNLKKLIKGLPSGFLADHAWLQRRGYSPSLIDSYVDDGFLERLTDGVYRMPGGRLQWEHVAISLQSIIGFPVVLGGDLAMHLHGHTHYVPYHGLHEVNLYGERTPPGWLSDLPCRTTACKTEFQFHRTSNLFPDAPAVPDPSGLGEWGVWTEGVTWRPTWENRMSRTDKAFMEASFTRKSWGVRDWPLLVSTPERAMLETIDQLPGDGDFDTFDFVDKFIEGPREINTDHMNTLLTRCGSVKVKRMFLWFAERHNHEWLKSIDISAINLGSGKHRFYKNGRMHAKYNIAMPAVDYHDIY